MRDPAAIDSNCGEEVCAATVGTLIAHAINHRLYGALTGKRRAATEYSGDSGHRISVECLKGSSSSSVQKRPTSMRNWAGPCRI